jgi:hypothetical protein
LLTVVLVIAVLAAISVPPFLSHPKSCAQRARIRRDGDSGDYGHARPWRSPML